MSDRSPIYFLNSNGQSVEVGSSNPLPTGGVSNANGAIPYHNLTTATANFTNAKQTACKLYGCDLSNTSGSIIYVKFYDKASAPGTGDVPKKTIQVPANGTVIRAFPAGLQFLIGFSWAATGAVADNDSTAIAANCVVDFELSI